jgi:hypothetical protein
MAADKERERLRKLEWQRQSHAQDPEKRNAPQRARYQESEEIRARSAAAHKRWHSQNKEYANAYRRRWAAENPEKAEAQRQRKRLRRYGLTIEQYDDIVCRQNNRCGVCRCSLAEIESKRIHIDHCHVTGRVRGVLCEQCNLGIGKFKENAEALARAAEYLQSGGSSWDF